MKDELDSLLAPHGQQHVLAFWDQLDQPGRESLAAQIRAVDLDLLGRLYQGRNEQGDFRALADRAGPPPAFRLDDGRKPLHARPGPHAAAARHWRPETVGAMLVAGGQGTRLGFDHPKGMFPIGPVSGRLAVPDPRREDPGRRAPLRRADSALPDDQPGDARRDRRLFRPARPLRTARGGLEDLLPGDDAGGRCAPRGGCCWRRRAGWPSVPTGTAACWPRSPAAAAWPTPGGAGLGQLFYFQVDNPLVEVCGAEYLGYHLLCGSEMSSQVIAKRDPLEKVGNVVAVDGRLMVIEYSDLPDDAAAAAQRRRLAGHLGRQHRGPRLRRGVSGADGRRGRGPALPRRAQEGGAIVDAAGRRVEPQQPNALKFERFIFDLMPSAAGRGGDRGRSGPGLRTAEERLRRQGRHAGGGQGADGGLASRLAPPCRRGSGATTWRSRSVRYSRWTPRSWPAKIPSGTRIAAADVFSAPVRMIL